jgi:hypothetical protein
VRNLKKLVSLCLFVTVVFATGCPMSPTLPPATAGGGFILQTSFSIDGSFPITGGWSRECLRGAASLVFFKGAGFEFWRATGRLRDGVSRR